MKDWYAEAARLNDKALDMESRRGVPHAQPEIGPVLLPDGLRYMVLDGNLERPSQGLLLFRPGSMEGVMIQPTGRGRVHARQGTVDIPDELAANNAPGLELTLAVFDMIDRASTEEREISIWALNTAAGPFMSMVEEYGIDALGKDWDRRLPADDERLLAELAERGVL